MKRLVRESIESGTLHPAFKDYAVKYAGVQSIYDRKTQTKHGIMVKERGAGNKWALLGADSAPFWYESEAEARKDVKLIKKWQKEQVA